MIGALRERVSFEQPSIGADGAGGGTLAWVAVSALPSVWARVEAMTGAEPVEAEAREGFVTWRITIRHRNDIRPDWRLVWRDMPFDILAAVPDPRRAYLTLLARTGAAQ